MKKPKDCVKKMTHLKCFKQMKKIDYETTVNRKSTTKTNCQTLFFCIIVEDNNRFFHEIPVRTHTTF